jgi:hypothetical protein
MSDLELRREIRLAEKAIAAEQEAEWLRNSPELCRFVDLVQRLRDQEEGLLSPAQIAELEVDLRRHLAKCAGLYGLQKADE